MLMDYALVVQTSIPWNRNIHGKSLTYMQKFHTLAIYDLKCVNISNCDCSSCLQASRVQINNVTYKNIWGSSGSNVAVTLRCSQSRPCRDVVLENINLPYYGQGGDATAFCSNIKGLSVGQQNPPSCMQSCHLQQVHFQ